MSTDSPFHLETERLVIRRLTLDDAAFILELLNEPLFIQNIADRGVRSVDDAKQYIANGPMASYARHGFGLFHVSRKADGVSIGICGLLRREYLDDVDVGFALLERYSGQGYATEAAKAVVDYGRRTLGLGRIVAITAMHNEASGNVLRKIGLRFDRAVSLPGHNGHSRLFVSEG